MSHTRPALRAEALEDRLTPAGGLDPTFGTGGKLTASPGPTVNVVLHVVVQPDGKFLVAGENPSYDFSVTRLNPDGSPDPTFAGGLGTAIDFAGASDFVDAMTLQPDGRIVMAGSAVVPFGSGTQLPIDMAVARVNPDGTTDTTFGDGGKAFAGIADRQTIASAVAVQPDGRIVLAGESYDPTTQRSDAVVARLTADGRPDPTFGTGGLVVLANGPLQAVAVQPDGRIVAAGLATASTNGQSQSQAAVIRLTSDGTPDPTFGTGGTAAVNLGAGEPGGVLQLQPDGKIVVGGKAGDFFEAARLNPDGSPDTTFGAGGTAAVGVGGPASVNGIALQPDGMIVLGGGSGTTGADFAVVRLTPAGTPDATFGAGGKVTVDFGRAEIARTVALDTAGRIVVAGGAGDLSILQGTFAAARLLGDSTPPVLVGGLPNGTAVVLTSVEGTYQPGGTVGFFPGVPINIRTATADVNGDGVTDYIGGAGPGALPSVMVLDGATGALLTSPLAFEPTFTGGVFVAAGDLDGDGRAEVIVTPDRGGGPNVVIFSLNPDGTLAAPRTFFALGNPAFRGGARPAVGDINGDGTPDLVIGAGFLGGPVVEVHDGKAVAAGDYATLIGSGFFAFDGSDAQTLRNGVFLAVGDINGDGFADLIAGGGPGGGPRVLVLDGKRLSAGDVGGAYSAPVANFFFGDGSSRGGVRVAAVDADGDHRADLVVGSGTGQPGAVQVYLAKDVTGAPDPTPAQNLDPFGATVPDGVFVG